MENLLNEFQALDFLNELGIDVTLPQLRRYRRKKVAPHFHKNRSTRKVGYLPESLIFFAQNVWQPGFSEKELMK